MGCWWGVEGVGCWVLLLVGWSKWTIGGFLVVGGWVGGGVKDVSIYKKQFYKY